MSFCRTRLDKCLGFIILWPINCGMQICGMQLRDANLFFAECRFVLRGVQIFDANLFFVGCRFVRRASRASHFTLSYFINFCMCLMEILTRIDSHILHIQGGHSKFLLYSGGKLFWVLLCLIPYQQKATKFFVSSFLLKNCIRAPKARAKKC